MNSGIALTLPGGLWLEGVRHQEAILRTPNAKDAISVHESRFTRSVAWRVTMFLARMVKGIGPVCKVTPAIIAALTVGDREALLLHARRLMFGERLNAVTRCPAPGCGAIMDLDLRVRDLLVPAYSSFLPEYETTVPAEQSMFRVCFRLPTGADQEGAAQQPTANDGAVCIFHRAVREITQDGKVPETVPPEVHDRISARMAELDCQAEVQLTSTCTSCGIAFTSLFDTAAYLFQELEARTPELLRDTHRLAFHYHWSESAILALPWTRRRAYTRLLEQELSEGRQ